jgi:hypothetical protein
MASVPELVGLSTPVVFAGATYSLFHWIDKNASGEAKAAITGWFKPLKYDRTALASALLELFDRIYGRPLLSLRSLVRSSVISMTLTLIYWIFFTDLISDVKRLRPQNYVFLYYIPVPLIFNAAADYISLFLVRRWLQIKEHSQFFIITTGALAGISVVLSLYIAREVLATSVMGRHLGMSETEALSTILTYWKDVISDLSRGDTSTFHPLLILPALATHFWLLLLAAAVASVKAANYFLWSVGKMQWFLKEGHKHPLDALGYVAATLVFVVMSISHWIY